MENGHLHPFALVNYRFFTLKIRKLYTMRCNMLAGVQSFGTIALCGMESDL